MRTYAPIDIDYQQFPVAGLSLDLHWIQLPTAVLIERRQAEREAQEKERAASPIEEELSGPSSTKPFTRLSGPIRRFSRKWWPPLIALSKNIAAGVTPSPPASIAPILPSGKNKIWQNEPGDLTQNKCFQLSGFSG